ncbi:HNH/endonuclease VII fold toxin-2 domain-containing protein [Paraburkholderia bannensis]|uniref:HNH/endonuclease VII fold toxin-2 domain-containing protein n=1 Tax=Paraburkholderia bannensis TaxID=765414 RepID=UPI002AB7D266|nr:HNH/endonuclease VII fold toxin-2 domain-containing protein [Paraburkholderia bannensis]
MPRKRLRATDSSTPSTDTSNRASKKSRADTSTSDQASASHSKHTTGPNTGSTFYFSNATVEEACAKDKKRIDDECGPDKASQSKHAAQNAPADDRHKGLDELAHKVRDGVLALDAAGRTASGYKENSKNAWIGNHCHGEWFKPVTTSNGFNEFKNELTKLQGDLKGEAMDLAKQAGWKVVDKAKTSATDYATRTLQKEGASAVSLLVPGVGEVVEGVTQVVVAADGVWTTLSTGWDMAKYAVNEGPKILSNMKNLYAQADKIAGWLKPEGIQDLWATQMSAVAIANPCLRARKCKLVPYSKTSNPRSQASSGDGCCPGQTGHHVLPDSMFYDYVSDGKGGSKQGAMRSCWGKYKHGDAPTMCLEGTTNNAANGSHGLAHDLTEDVIKGHRNAPSMSYTMARDRISDVLAIPYGCSPACIKAQLDKYYKDAHTCGDLKNAEVTPHSGNAGGGPKGPESDDTTF